MQISRFCCLLLSCFPSGGSEKVSPTNQGDKTNGSDKSRFDNFFKLSFVRLTLSCKLGCWIISVMG